MPATTADDFARLRTAAFKGAGRRLADEDLPRLGSAIGVGEDEIHAIIDVESSGSGFDGQGRPKILFEPHVFYRNLAGAPRAAAVKAGLAYPTWGEKPYPKDSYPRLIQALAIDEAAALKACSWGLTQILGENHRDCGYASPQAMVAAFAADEAEQLAATIQLIVAKGLAGALRAHDWPKVARGWNGPGYAKNGYDTKLASRWAFWRKIPDTPWPPAHREVAAPASQTIAVPPSPPNKPPVQAGQPPMQAVPVAPVAPVAPAPAPASPGLLARVADRLRAAYPLTPAKKV